MQIYYTITEMVELIEDDLLRSVAKGILDSNEELFKVAPGSSHNHQAWPGGYWDHVRECMNIACFLYKSFSEHRKLPFNKGDALFVMFVHDLEKPWRYRLTETGELETIPELLDKQARKDFRDQKLAEMGVDWNNYPEVMRALMTVEGENENYSPKQRVMNELGALCHMCDVASARLWYDFPAKEVDEWAFAHRVRN